MLNILACAVLVCSCATNPAHTDVRGVTIRLLPDSVPLEGTPDSTKLNVNVIVHNDRTTPLYFYNCGGPQLEQEIGGQWQPVWSPACFSPTGGSIAANDSLTIPFMAYRFANENVHPRLDPKATPGRYRLQLGTAYSGPVDYGHYRNVPAPPPPKTLGQLISPIFIVYAP